MKKYAIFSFERYYPKGGLNDLFDTFETKEEALNHYKVLCKHSDRHERVQLVDLEELKILECNYLPSKYFSFFH